MENLVPKLWDATSGGARGLRLPNTPVDSAKQITEKENTKITANSFCEPPPTSTINITVVENSKLSANAAEFVPSYLRNDTQGNNTITPSSLACASVQNRLMKHKLSTEATYSSAIQQPIKCDEDFLGSADDVRMKQIIDTLTRDPGQFNNLFDIFMDTLNPYLENVLVLSSTTELLVNQVSFINTLKRINSRVIILGYRSSQFSIYSCKVMLLY